MKLASAATFLQACRRGASVDEMDALITVKRRDERICFDALAIARIASEIADGAPFPNEGANEVAGLLARVRYLMETA